MSLNRKALHGRGGFTLVEIMVVVVILGVLASIVVGSYMGQADKVKVEATRTSIKNIGAAINLYRLQQNRYPNSLDDLINRPAEVKTGNWPEGGYLSETPRDGWDNKFEYKLESSGYIITSLGADNQQGGDGINQDITNKDKLQD